MGQKVNPISNRLGIIRGWDSNWFGGKDFGDNLVEDQSIRKYLNKRLEKAMVSRIVIERTLKLVTITICTARPGIVIGKGGQDVDKLKEELKKLYKKDIHINIFEVRKPELDATIVILWIRGAALCGVAEMIPFEPEADNADAGTPKILFHWLSSTFFCDCL